MDATSDELTSRFPWPVPPHPAVVPTPLHHAGWSSNSTEAVLANLKDNHQQWHIFFGDEHFHNHAAHHLLTIYTMGAPASLLNAAYHTHAVYLKPAFQPPETNEERIAREAAAKVVIDDTNWKDYLGDDRYYQAYASFFSSKLLDKAAGKNVIQRVLEDYVFSIDANLTPGKSANGQRPLILARFLSGFMHPHIHAGYGAEFGLPGLIAEGVSEAAVQLSEADALFTPDLFGAAANATDLASKVTSLAFSSAASISNVHALEIIARVANDPTFAPHNIGRLVPADAGKKSMDHVVRIGGTILVEYLTSWFGTVNEDAATLRAKFEEMVWMNTVIYAVAGWAKRELGEDETKEFNGDFFLMHLVTSSLLTSLLLNVLIPKSVALLLKTSFALSIVLYVTRSCPPLPIDTFYAHTTTHPHPPGPTPMPDKDMLPPNEPRSQLTPNPWLPIVQMALWFGGTRARTFAGLSSPDLSSLGSGGLTGAEMLDGTLFLRAAWLTAGRLGWMRESEKGRMWDGIAEI
ncbi:uncharacterized protein PHACADRAFT_202161 [Phanerochaete carnosa HHB-10118-sp]|uniref:Oxidoreductase AflY n=1 Tax=Phanerochaete carnosa (strain HHB-10118-sp) TaxID=650164 RepID=K5WFM1_PHACS|nr:uncharacterized protein PHACADRAFT_202161 [Phanerochaete carnosa HHB-10118-sp]EKM48982.1 hypothetical protein PHACADRAFT_202161 [Phanerochaete carnosa HHB-10118-sp]